jgi:hypothetical protein
MRRAKRSFPRAAALTLTAAACVVSARPAAAQETVRVGAWNIEWLGFPETRGRPGKGIEQKAADLGEYVHASGVQVLALEEIGVDSTQTLKSPQLQAMFDYLKQKHGQSWQYVLHAKANYPPGAEPPIVRGQHVGLAWRTDVATRVGEPVRIDIGTNPTYGRKFWERRATAVKLSFGQGKTDAVFIPVHPKSNRNTDNPEDRQWTYKQRAAEVAALVLKLQSVREKFGDQDLVILGDFNFLWDDDLGAGALAAAGFRDLNATDGGTTAAWGDGYSSAPFDRIFVTASQPEFAAAQQKVWRNAGGDSAIREFRIRHSDHYLVTCDIKLAADDD